MRLNRRSKWMVFGIALPVVAATIGATLHSVFRPTPFYYQNHNGNQYAAWTQGGRLIVTRTSPSFGPYVPKLNPDRTPRFDPWPRLGKTYLASHFATLPRSQAASAYYVVHGVNLPYWMIGLPCIVAAFWAAHRSGWITRVGACGRCGYDLAGCDGPVCPECGPSRSARGVQGGRGGRAG